MIGELAAAAVAFLGYRWWRDRRADQGYQDDAAASKKYEFVSGYAGGAKEGDDVPVVVLLHGQNSTPQEAIDRVPITRPARVLVPRGLVPEANGKFSFFNRNLTGAARDAAIYEASTALGKAVSDVVEAKDYGVTKPATPKRAVVVGLDVSGPLAIAVALRNPLQVRQAWAEGGSGVPGTWLPASMPPMNNLAKPVIRKISYGPALDIDVGTAKKASDMGWFYVVSPVDGGVVVDNDNKPLEGPAAARAFWANELLPMLEEQLSAP